MKKIKAVFFFVIILGLLGCLLYASSQLSFDKNFSIATLLMMLSCFFLFYRRLKLFDEKISFLWKESPQGHEVSFSFDSLLTEFQLNWALAKGLLDPSKSGESDSRFIVYTLISFVTHQGRHFDKSKKILGDLYLLLHYFEASNRYLDRHIQERKEEDLKGNLKLLLIQMKKILLNLIKYEQELFLLEKEIEDIKHLKELVSQLIVQVEK